MRTVLAVIFLSFFCAAFAPSRDDGRAPEARSVSVRQADPAADGGYELPSCCMECSCDLRLPSPQRSLSERADGGVSARMPARPSRGAAAKLSGCPASAACAAGRVTRLFEFNLYTSSLRCGYFLHSLCRLRI